MKGNKSKHTGFMHIAMGNATFYYENEGDENKFYAKELFIENGGAWADNEDGVLKYWGK